VGVDNALETALDPSLGVLLLNNEHFAAPRDFKTAIDGLRLTETISLFEHRPGFAGLGVRDPPA
jgi:hypothetical protein